MTITITITRAEGPANLCGKPETFPTFSEANARLFSMSVTAPKGGGYDKCDFKIEGPEGFLYHGRYDLKHFTEEAPDLKGHCVGYLRFMAGAARPLHMSEDRYRQFLIDQKVPVERLQEYLAASNWLEKQP